jgi:hypothetical protein
MKLLAELEYLSTLGQYLMDECDKALQECRRLDGRAANRGFGQRSKA